MIEHFEVDQIAKAIIGVESSALLSTIPGEPNKGQQGQQDMKLITC